MMPQVDLEVRALALQAWLCADPLEKALAARTLQNDWVQGRLSLSLSLTLSQTLGQTLAQQSLNAADLVTPGRPVRPQLVAAGSVPNRPANSAAGRIALMHAIAHIEFNAIDLALDAIWRFDGMPQAYYADWVLVADEEAQHFLLVCEWLAGQDASYGDCDAHDGLWQMAARTAHDPIARMALVPSVLEARGLDATPMIQERLRRNAKDLRNARDLSAVATIESALTILDRILNDEIGHVRIGRQWFEWLCAQAGLAPETTFDALMETFNAPWPKPPVNRTARLAAGFTEAQLDRFSQADRPSAHSGRGKLSVQPT
jgi:uncharacterized ferritin-like protein (DUF455 family)